MDMDRAKEFAQELLSLYGAAMTVMFIDIGDRTGLLAARAEGGTSPLRVTAAASVLGAVYCDR